MIKHTYLCTENDNAIGLVSKEDDPFLDELHFGNAAIPGNYEVIGFNDLQAALRSVGYNIVKVD